MYTTVAIFSLGYFPEKKLRKLGDYLNRSIAVYAHSDTPYAVCTGCSDRLSNGNHGLRAPASVRKTTGTISSRNIPANERRARDLKWGSHVVKLLSMVLGSALKRGVAFNWLSFPDWRESSLIRGFRKQPCILRISIIYKGPKTLKCPNAFRRWTCLSRIKPK